MKRFLLGILLFLCLILTLAFFGGCEKGDVEFVSEIWSILSEDETDAVPASSGESGGTETSGNASGISRDTPILHHTEPALSSFICADPEKLPPYSGSTYTEINGNLPMFTAEELTDAAYEYYSPLDRLGRCGMTVSCVGKELMPEGERESISQIKPTGWISSRYDFVEGKSLYNRSHLLGYQLTGESANKYNLITGTRYLNACGMIPFEDMVADYVKETGGHVLYRVTPVFRGDELIARGVEMEGLSVEDRGASVCFHVYIYNVQPGVIIDYATGKNQKDPAVKGEEVTYIINTNSKKYHLTTCPSLPDTKDKNKETYIGTREILEAQGYAPCQTCHP